MRPRPVLIWDPEAKTKTNYCETETKTKKVVSRPPWHPWWMDGLNLAIPLLQKCIWPCCDLELWSLTLKTLSAMLTHMMNICEGHLVTSICDLPDVIDCQFCEFSVKKTKQHQKVKNNIEMHTAQNYTLNETKQGQLSQPGHLNLSSFRGR